MESAQATEYLTLVMQGYNLSAREAIGIVDKLTAVNLAGTTPIDGLAQALAETAQSADTVGVSMDKLVGYMAVTGEATQKSMNSISESYSSIFERMSNVQAGKLFDESTGEDLSDVEDSLSAVGIQLRDSKDSFKDLGDVIDEIASKWDNYSDAEQSSIATAIAGAGQQEDFVALMENYGDALSYAGSAADSSGAALERYESYQDGIEGKTKALAASFEELSMSLINSDFIKMLIDTARGFIEILNVGDGIIPKFALVISGVSGISKAFKTLGSSKIAGGTEMMVPVKYARHTPVVTLNEQTKKRVLSARVYERIS